MKKWSNNKAQNIFMNGIEAAQMGASSITVQRYIAAKLVSNLGLSQQQATYISAQFTRILFNIEGLKDLSMKQIIAIHNLAYQSETKVA